jgi:hypothetical protein
MQCGWNPPNSTLLYNTGAGFATGAFTMIASTRLTSLGVNQIAFSGGSYDGANGGGRSIYVDSTNKFGFDSKGISYMSASTVTTGVNYVMMARWDGTTLKLYLNNVLVYNASAALGVNGQGRICIGSGTSGGLPWKGYVGQSWYWNSYMTDDLASAINQTFMTKWGAV